MATKDSWSATAESAEIVPENEFRDFLLIQKTNDTVVALGIGEAAVAGKGIQLVNINDAVRLRGHWARQAINAIGNGGAGTYQEGDIELYPGPYIA